MVSLKLGETSVKGRTGDCSKNLGRTAVSGDMLIELGNSWFSAKTIEVVRHKVLFLWGKAINGPIYKVGLIKL